MVLLSCFVKQKWKAQHIEDCWLCNTSSSVLDGIMKSCEYIHCSICLNTISLSRLRLMWKIFQRVLKTNPGWKHTRLCAPLTQQLPGSAGSRGLWWLPNDVPRELWIGRTHAGREERLAVTGRVTWYSIIRRHDNPASNAVSSQRTASEGLAGGGSRNRLLSFFSFLFLYLLQHERPPCEVNHCIALKPPRVMQGEREITALMRSLSFFSLSSIH